MLRAFTISTLILPLLCGSPVATGSDATADIDAPLLKQYKINIETLSRQVNIAKEHRTAIIGRMDAVAHQLTDLDDKVQQVVDRQPTLRDGLADVDSRIQRLSESIVDTDKTLEFISHQIDSLPVPSLWEDAFRRASTKRRDRAVKEYQRFQTARQLTELKQMQQALVSSRLALFDSFQGIEGSVSSLSSERTQLEEKRRALETQFVDLSAQIVEYQDRRSTLESRLHKITEFPEIARFSHARGVLPDPTPGALRHEYAEPKAQGLLKWEGIVIDAPLGQEVNAVFDGKVVFADHMQGLGNVAIVDHGEGYMSLYGMADFLIVEPGQIVLAGDTIGTVGTPVGNDESSLYFEIRQNADTLNPADWLKSHSFSTEPES
jgi:murein DD-endopeptidase MepM/ murein hydrolase activator NlpD